MKINSKLSIRIVSLESSCFLNAWELEFVYLYFGNQIVMLTKTPTHPCHAASFDFRHASALFISVILLSTKTGFLVLINVKECFVTDSAVRKII
jgi:hypothetical protein